MSKIQHFDYTLNYNSLIDQNAEIIDNSFVMLLNVLTKTSVHHAACAGFDGYTVDGDNYYNSAMDYRIAREKSQSINQYVIDTLERLGRNADAGVPDGFEIRKIKKNVPFFHISPPFPATHTIFLRIIPV